MPLRIPLPSWLVRRAARLRADERGAILLPLALALPVLFGFGLLVIDGGRLLNLHTSLQAGADALALAGAAELDRRPQAIDRADRAMRTLLENDQRFGDGPRQVTATWRYARSLPARDSDPITAYTTDPAEARFVEVRTQPVALTSYFARAASLVQGPNQVRAVAVGGFEQAVCNFTPFFICNPFEGTGTNIFDGVRDQGWRGRLFLLKSKGNGVQYFPGNFGYLDPPAGKGADEVREMLAAAAPKACFRQSGVYLRTGNISSVSEAINVRFDLYDGAFGGAKSDYAYRPARNVRKGYVGSACNPSPAVDPDQPPTRSAPALGFPRDGCLYTGTCPTVNGAMAGRIGDGRWDIETYWHVNYGGMPPNGWTNANPPTRYEVYLYEIENNLTSRASQGITSGGRTTSQEQGAPQCYAGGGTLDESPDRRMIMAAVLDCNSLGPVNGGSGGPYPTTAFARLLLTEPMDKQDSTVFAELIDIVEPGTPGARDVVRDIVQLHR